MSYLDYKAAEQNLKDRFPNNAVRVESIDNADVYYTDGDASASTCKLIFTGGNTVYVPQLIYNVIPEHKEIIQEWMEYAANRGTPFAPAVKPEAKPEAKAEAEPEAKPEAEPEAKPEAPVATVAPSYFCCCFLRKRGVHRS